jgi:hypothetical protein
MEEDAQVSSQKIGVSMRLLGVVLGLLCPLIIVVTGQVAATPFGADNQAITQILARKFVKQTVVVPGGHYAAPYILATPNTEYVLDGDIMAEGTAIAIRAARVVLNLNGKTITYNQAKPGEGITIDYHSNDVSIINGNIIQGAAMSEGDVYGSGNNPIKSLGISRLQIANIHARYGGRDVNGFHLKYVGGGIVENCTLEDTWHIGTMKNRHQGKAAIGIGDHAVVRNNTIINARQGGIGASNNSEIYGNIISINSMATNSAGIGGYKAKNIKVHHNTITGRGEHPLGIAFVSAGTDNIEIYSNTIDVQSTRLGEEYAGAGGNYAVGFRTTWGGNNISFHDNTIVVRTDSAYKGTRSSTGVPVVVNAKGRGLMVAINAGEKARFYSNRITVLDKDGSGRAFGIACTGNNAGELIFEGNTVTSNILNVALGDEYGACGGYPLFVRNTFVKEDTYPAYKTVASEMGGYFDGTGLFVSNRYQGGATRENININAAGKSPKSVCFGREIMVELLADDGIPIANARLTLQNGGGPFDSSATTDDSGKARLIVYDYELHNRPNKTAQTRLFAPHRIEAVIGTRVAYSAISTPEPWEALQAKGEYFLKLYGDDRLTTIGTLKISYEK